MSTIDEIETYYDRVADSYDERAAANSQITILDNVTWKWIKGHLPEDKGSRILDAGGGTGKWAIPIAKMGYGVTILDISEGMLRVARRKVEEERLEHLITLKQGNIEEMAFPQESFEFILCEGDAFGLTPKPEKALHEFYRILRQNGAVSLNICNHYKLLALTIQRMESFDGVRKYFAETSYGREPLQGATFRAWKPEEAFKMIASAGFDIEAYAPRMIMVDLLSEEVVKAMREDGTMMKHVQQIEEELSQHSVLIALGGLIMILAKKKASSYNEGYD